MKTTKFLILLLLGTCLTMVSCKKKYTTVVKGRIINKHTKEPIAGVYVTLKSNIGAGGEEIEAQQSVYTDANGYYAVSIQSKEKKAYFAIAHNLFYAGMTEQGEGYGLAFKPIPYGKVNEFNMTMYGYGLFDCDFYNENSLETDSCYVKYLKDGSLTEELPVTDPMDLFWHMGSTKYNKATAKAEGDTYLRFLIKYQKSGIWHEKLDSVFLHTGDDWLKSEYKF